MKIFLLIAVGLVAAAVEAKTFTRCELVKALRAQNFPEGKIRDCKYLSAFVSTLFISQVRGFQCSFLISLHFNC